MLAQTQSYLHFMMVFMCVWVCVVVVVVFLDHLLLDRLWIVLCFLITVGQSPPVVEGSPELAVVEGLELAAVEGWEMAADSLSSADVRFVIPCVLLLIK